MGRRADLATPQRKIVDFFAPAARLAPLPPQPSPAAAERPTAESELATQRYDPQGSGLPTRRCRNKLPNVSRNAEVSTQRCNSTASALPTLRCRKEMPEATEVCTQHCTETADDIES